MMMMIMTVCDRLLSFRILFNDVIRLIQSKTPDPKLMILSGQSSLKDPSHHQAKSSDRRTLTSTTHSVPCLLGIWLDLFSTILLSTLIEGGRRCGRPRKCWMDNIKEWTSLPKPEQLTRASCRTDWNRTSAESSLMSPRRLYKLRG